jgi:hypothetical protein
MTRIARMLVAASAACAAACVLALGAAAANAAAPARISNVAEIDAAVKVVAEDPNLGGEKKERKLHWKESKKEVKDPPVPEWIKWLGQFFDWVNEAARVLVWVLGGIAVIVVLLVLRRWLAVRGEPAGRMRGALPTHVRDLDIRPESLPDDIGAAAWQRWQAARDWQERRGALSLLYRGTLSRLVHVYRVPIRASSTEGECMRLARAAFQRIREPAAEHRADLVDQLIDVWQRAVYGLQAPDDATVRDLCMRFGPTLSGPEAMSSAPPPSNAAPRASAA